MREDDEIQHYAPLLRRIIVVVAVVTAVPVMMWTATTFMHRYVMRPDMPWLRSTAAQQPDAAITTATATAPARDPNVTQAAPKIVEASAATTDASAASADGTPTPGGQITGTAAAAPAPTPAAAAPAASFSAAAPAGATTPLTAYPVATAASAPDPTSSPAANPGPSAPIAVATIASDDATSALPTADPLVGPVPLPRHRPNVFALVETGAVPMPRVRPEGNTPQAAPPSAYSYPSGYDPAMGHY